MHATYQFDPKQLSKLPLTMTFTANINEWKNISDALASATKGDTLTPLMHCIKNLVKAIEDATGQTYSTRGYTYSAEQSACVTE
jgi:hypothetical protein